MTLDNLVDALDDADADRISLLCAAFPRLFARRPDPHMIDWPSGWTTLVVGTLARTEAVLTDHGGRMIMAQIKEKLGELRLYGDRSDLPEEARSAVDAVFKAAMLESAQRCGLCGAAGRASERAGWFGPTCRRHQAPPEPRDLSLSAHRRLALLRALGAAEFRAIACDQTGRRAGRLRIERGGRRLAVTVVEDARGLYARALLSPEDHRDDEPLEEVLALEAGVAEEAARLLGITP